MSTQNNTHAAVIFSFRRDAEIAFQAVTALQRAFPGLPVNVAVDAAAPFTPEQSALFAQWDCVYITTTDFPRAGNLNGQACIQGILDTLAVFADETGAQWVWKVDSDSAIFDHELFTARTHGHRAIFPWNSGYMPAAALGAYPGGWGMGWAYALRADGIAALKERVATAAIVAEDKAISLAAVSLWGDEVERIPLGAPNWSGFKFVNMAAKGVFFPLAKAGEFARSRQAVTFGDRSNLPAAFSAQDKVDAIALYMARANLERARLEAAE